MAKKLFSAFIVMSAGFGQTVAADGGLPVSAPPSDRQMHVLARCESSNNPRAVSRSGKYRGLYQFDRRTWNGVARRWGRHDLVGVDPARTDHVVQTAMARALYRERGWKPWPVCGRRAART